jgi:hypothetical protein
MPLQRRLDDVLADAGIPADPAGEEEIAASRRRIEADFAEAVRHTGAGGAPAYALPAGDSLFLLGGQSFPDAAPHARAARYLRELSVRLISNTGAAEQIAELASTHAIDPDGALTFGCLLHLADREDGAESLWQFAAGAGKPASAACLYLLHLKRGDLRDARHWARQAAVLEALDAKARRKKRGKDSIGARRRHPVPAYCPPAGIPEAVMLLRTLHALQPVHSDDVSITAFHTRTGTLSSSLTQAVQRLKTETHPGYGLITWPDQNLAAELQQCLPSC